LHRQKDRKGKRALTTIRITKKVTVRTLTTNIVEPEAGQHGPPSTKKRKEQ
jgi:hypothetical protein